MVIVIIHVHNFDHKIFVKTSSNKSGQRENAKTSQRSFNTLEIRN